MSNHIQEEAWRSNTLAALFSVYRKVLAGLQEMLQARRNRKEIAYLLNLDDHMLSDLGITRADVEHALGVPRGDDPSMQLQMLRSERRAARRRRGR